VDSHSLVCSIPALPITTYYLGIQDHANIVIDLIFLSMSYAQVFYCIEPDLRWPSDYAHLIIDLSITSEKIHVYRIVLKHNSEEEVTFLLFISEDLS